MGEYEQRLHSNNGIAINELIFSLPAKFTWCLDVATNLIATAVVLVG